MEANSPSPDAPSSELPPLRLSPDEQQVLTLYDQLGDLELKVALLKAQTAYIPDTAPEAEASLEAAQSAASAAKATYLLRNTITDAVLTANPTLQAVHSSTRATPIESDLLPKTVPVCIPPWPPAVVQPANAGTGLSGTPQRSAEWVMRGRIRTSVCVDHAGEKGRQDVVVVVLNPIRHFPRIDQAGNHAIATRTRLSVDRNI
ncbi:hypothetical protein HYQ44_002101 [Verticillium longisporum]|nr:hypothetical protein HYQ44_002101 [Verticillium longisporum]